MSESLGNGLELQIENFKSEHSDLNLVVIDTLQMVRNEKDCGYGADYKELSVLKSLADKLAFQCGGYQTKGNSHCTSHYIRESVLNEIVLTSLRQMTAYARENTEEFYAMATANCEAEAERFYATAERQKTQITARISHLDNIIRCLYEDRVTGRITPERYDTMTSGYELEQAELRQELQCITKKIDEMDLREMYVKEFIAKAKTYIEMPELTPELLRVFIRRIEVYEKAEKYSRTCGREISMEYIKRVAIYARYSTDMQRTESISAQVRAMEQYCHQRRWKIVAKYIDEAISATTDRRPQFQQMIEDSSKKAFDIVLVHKLDRFSRNRYDSTIYKSKLRQNNVMLCSVLEKIDDSPESVILESILEGISEYYSRNLSREVMKGMKENAYQARHCGGSAPLGYDVNSDGYLVINPHEAEAVRMIFQLYIDGYGLKQIANKINSLGYKTKSGKPFVNSSFHSILTNIKYTGTFVFNQSVAKDCNHKRNSHKHKPESEIIKIKNGCPKIIPTNMFEQAQKQRIKNRNSKAMLKSNMFYLCSGIVKCGICVKTMFGSQRIVPGFFVYTCKSHLDICNNTKEISKDKLDKYAAELVGSEILNPDKMTVRIPLLNQRIDEHNQKIVLKRQSIIHKIEVITLKMLKLDDENKIDSKYLQLEEQRLNLKRELSLLHELSHINLEKYSEYIIQYTSLNREETKFRTLIQRFVREIIVYKTKVKFVLDNGLGILDNYTEKHYVSRNKFLTPPQQKKLNKLI